MSVLSPAVLLAHEAANANTACTAIYNPGTLNDSNIISAVYSLFSGVFSGGSVYTYIKHALILHTAGTMHGLYIG